MAVAESVHLRPQAALVVVQGERVQLKLATKLGPAPVAAAVDGVRMADRDGVLHPIQSTDKRIHKAEQGVRQAVEVVA